MPCKMFLCVQKECCVCRAHGQRGKDRKRTMAKQLQACVVSSPGFVVARFLGRCGSSFPQVAAISAP